MNDYYYRKHIKIFRYLNIVPLGIVIIMLCILAIIAEEGKSIFLIIALILTFELVAIWCIMGRFKKVRISIDDEKIIYKNYKEEKLIKFEDITCIQFPSIKYIGGWMKIKSNNKTTRFTVVIKDVHRLSLKIKEQIDKRVMNNVYIDKRYNNFIKTATYADDSWERVYKIWWKLVLFTIVTSTFSITIGLFFQLRGVVIFLLTLISSFYPTLVYIITEVIFARKVGRLFKKNIGLILTRDTMYEGSVYKKALIMSLVIYILAALIFIVYLY